LFILPKSSFGEHKVVTKIVASHKTHHIASHVATIFCNHLAKIHATTKAMIWVGKRVA
jgi:hypothetical protein